MNYVLLEVVCQPRKEEEEKNTCLAEGGEIYSVTLCEPLSGQDDVCKGCSHPTIQILPLESCAARAKFSKIGLNLNIHPYLMDLQT